MVLAAILTALAVGLCIFLAVVVMRIARPAAGPPPALQPTPEEAAIATDAPIAPEILARIEQEVAARLGPGARIRSVKHLEVPGSRANSWAQQGRVAIQGSHRTGDRLR